jgi:hypothetical protein
MDEQAKPKKVEEICGNCRLYDRNEKNCRVVILYKGERLKIPVDPTDKCFYQGKFIAAPVPFQEEVFNVEIQQVRFWEENGKVKIEYPEGFFGEESGSNR